MVIYMYFFKENVYVFYYKIYIYIYIYIYDSFQCMTKPTTLKKRDLQKFKKKNVYIYIIFK